MIIDAHAHLVAPPSLYAYKANLLADGGYNVSGNPKVGDDELAASAAGNVKLMDEVGTDLQLISPRPYHLMHSVEPPRLVHHWVAANNDTIARTVALHPDRFAGVGAIPTCPSEPIEKALPEVRRMVDDLGFVGVLLNPDPAEGRGHAPVLGDRFWYPLYELLVELDVPAHIHSAGCYSGRESYSEHFISEESTAIISLLRSSVFTDFPGIRFLVSHGGGSVPYQVGRWQAERRNPAFASESDEPFEQSLRSLYYDTVLHHPPSLELLLKLVGADRCVFGTERPGSGSALNPATGRDYDDLRPVIEGFDFLSDDDRHLVFEGNARVLFPRLPALG